MLDKILHIWYIHFHDFLHQVKTTLRNVSSCWAVPCFLNISYELLKSAHLLHCLLVTMSEPVHHHLEVGWRCRPKIDILTSVQSSLPNFSNPSSAARLQGVNISIMSTSSNHTSDFLSLNFSIEKFCKKYPTWSLTSKGRNIHNLAMFRIHVEEPACFIFSL